MRTSLRLLGPVLAIALAWLLHACLAPRGAGAARWWKGNTHTHTLWSDGDGAPELVAATYRERGYDFLVLSDHNVLSEGETWFPVEEQGRLTPARVEQLRARFGARAVELREVIYDDGSLGTQMRLVTLPELRWRFEAPGEFLFLQGEEITDSFEGTPVHVNGVNLLRGIQPLGGASLRETLLNNVWAVAQQSQRLGKPMLAHVNHPNFGWALTWEDLAALRDDRFFEVYNGHPAVHNEGDAERPSLERMWDLALTRRLTELDLGLLYGLATDDAHNYHEERVGLANVGRGWVMVRAARLDADELVRAMQRGDFYATSGVLLDDFASDAGRYRVVIQEQPGVAYVTRFVGTRVRPGTEAEVGVVLAETRANPAEYALRGDELYVRAVVVSDRPHPNPYAEGDVETAWLQPVGGALAGR